MSKPPSRISQSGRLVSAVREARASQSLVRAPATGLADLRANSSKKQVQGAIKYPKASNALRQHVVEARTSAEPASTFRLRFAKAGPTTHDEPRKVHRPEPVASPERKSAPAGSVRNRLAISQQGQFVETPADLGRVVRLARRLHNLTQAELASLAGTGRRFVSELEAGKPSVEFQRLLGVCRVLGVHLTAAIDHDGR